MVKVKVPYKYDIATRLDLVWSVIACQGTCTPLSNAIATWQSWLNLLESEWCFWIFRRSSRMKRWTRWSVRLTLMVTFSARYWTFRDNYIVVTRSDTSVDDEYAGIWWVLCIMIFNRELCHSLPSFTMLYCGFEVFAAGLADATIWCNVVMPTLGDGQINYEEFVKMMMAK